MKKLIVILLLLGQIGSPQAEIVLDAGNTRYIFNDADKDSEMVKSFTRIAEIDKAAYTNAKRLEQIKDDLGLGPLERLLVSSRKYPSFDEVKAYRGANTDSLFALLKNESFAAYWGEIAKAIGIIGDEKDAERLARYASTPFQEDASTIRHYISAREGAIWGLKIAWEEQGMPWVRDFLVAHANPDQWVEDFGDIALNPDTASRMAKNTMAIISLMGNDESLKMLKEVREQHMANMPVQPFRDSSAESKTNNLLDHIDMRIEQTKLFAKQRAEEQSK